MSAGRYNHKIVEKNGKDIGKIINGLKLIKIVQKKNFIV